MYKTLLALCCLLVACETCPDPQDITGRYPAEGEVVPSGPIEFSWDKMLLKGTFFLRPVDQVDFETTSVGTGVQWATRTAGAGDYEWKVSGTVYTDNTDCMYFARMEPTQFTVEPAAGTGR